MLDDNTIEFFLRNLYEIGSSSQRREMLLFVSSNVAAMTSRANQAMWALIIKNTFKGSPTINEYYSIFPYTSPFKYAISSKSHNISQNIASPTLPIMLVETRHPAFLPSITWKSLWTTLIVLIFERFESRSHFKSRLSLIVRVNVVLNRTVVVDSDWCFDKLRGSHLQSQSELYHDELLENWQFD